MLVTVQDRCNRSGVSSWAILPLPPKRRTWFDMFVLCVCCFPRMNSLLADCPHNNERKSLEFGALSSKYCVTNNVSNYVIVLALHQGGGGGRRVSEFRHAAQLSPQHPALATLNVVIPCHSEPKDPGNSKRDSRPPPQAWTVARHDCSANGLGEF